MTTKRFFLQNIELDESSQIVYHYERITFDKIEHFHKGVFKNTLTSEGRIRRAEFTLSLLIFSIFQGLIFEVALIGDYTHFFYYTIVSFAILFANAGLKEMS